MTDRFIGPILDDRLKETPETLKGCPQSHFRVSPSVYTRATEHSFLHRNLFSGNKTGNRNSLDFFGVR